MPLYKPPKKGQPGNPIQDIIDDDSDDDITPGPGDYYDQQHSTFYSKAKPERLQFFGSTSTRFTGKVKPSGAGVLGPGSYDVAHDTSGKPPKPKRSAPFNNGADRWNKSSTIKAGEEDLEPSITPGPGAYSQPGIGEKPPSKNWGKNGVFGSTERRFVQ